MLSPLIDYILGAPPEKLEELSIEDMALCAAWYRSLENDPEEQRSYAALSTSINQWVNSFRHVELDTEGRRQQPVLRRTIDKCLGRGVDSLNRSELDFLDMAFQLLQRLTDNSPHKRVLAILEKNAQQVVSQRKKLEPCLHLSELDTQIEIISSKDIERKRPRGIRYFAGVDLPCRGPVYTCKKDVKVLDLVPEGCMLVVESGSCWVNGFVMGRVAARGDCVVRENIAGVVIVRDGDIRARGVVNQAFVVAKRGSAFVYRSDHPRLFYANTRIHIRKDTVMGTYAAPSIEVGEDAFGGEYSVSQEFSARLFRRAENRPMAVFLQRFISGQSYGELLDREGNRLVSRITKERNRRKSLRDLRTLTDDECEQFAATAITYMLGGETIRRYVDGINSTQRRIAFLDRVIAGIDALGDTVEVELREQIRFKNVEKETETETEPDDDAIDLLELELQELFGEGQDDEVIESRHSELQEMTAEIGVERERNRITDQSLTRLKEKKVEWLLERDEAITVLATQQRSLRDKLSQDKLLTADEAKGSKLQVLMRLIKTARGKGSGNKLMERLASNFMRVMVKSIESRRNRIKKYDEQIDVINEKLSEDGRVLQQEYNIVMPPEDDEDGNSARIVGRFERGVRICTEPYLLESRTPPEGSRRISADSRGAMRCYMRVGSTIEEVE